MHVSASSLTFRSLATCTLTNLEEIYAAFWSKLHIGMQTSRPAKHIASLSPQPGALRSRNDSSMAIASSPQGRLHRLKRRARLARCLDLQIKKT
ncbi:Hypothetical predicted protein [Pelobates cultripes]|uniref:Uncharacterized protein n=1 Tax=Pelobates cultripes TaxID=61616 RepID=A0AAD1T647_PELCU|nr:Hypothetical predicted protein [Pelobates cultripes]